jgi:tRNA uridine 5-carboxymethylaminomethyl modification enzyme
VALLDLLRRPELSFYALRRLACELSPQSAGWEPVSREVAEQLEIQVRYEGYIERQSVQVEAAVKLEAVPIPEHVDYDRVRALSYEGREKLGKIRPATLGQASRIPGLRPGDIQVLSIYLKTLNAKAVAPATAAL